MQARSTAASANDSVPSALLFVALLAPYCILRLIALITAQDPGSAAHLRGHLATLPSAGVLIDGLWSGLRALWVFVIVAQVLLASRGRLVQAGLLVLLVAATAAANVSIAADLSRAASTLVPAAVLGIILLVRARPDRAFWPIAAALAFNLVAPAWHAIAGWGDEISILPLHAEVRRLLHPPTQVAVLHLNRAVKLGAQRQPARALAEIETAIKIDPRSPVPQISRGMMLDELGKTTEAAKCYDRAVSLAPALPETYAQRARFRAAHDDYKSAIEDLRAAIDLTPAASPERQGAWTLACSVTSCRGCAVTRSSVSRRLPMKGWGVVSFSEKRPRAHRQRIISSRSHRCCRCWWRRSSARPSFS